MYFDLHCEDQYSKFENKTYSAGISVIPIILSTKELKTSNDSLIQCSSSPKLLGKMKISYSLVKHFIKSLSLLLRHFCCHYFTERLGALEANNQDAKVQESNYKSTKMPIPVLSV